MMKDYENCENFAAEMAKEIAALPVMCLSAIKTLGINDTFRLKGEPYRLFIRLPEMGLNTHSGEFVVNCCYNEYSKTVYEPPKVIMEFLCPDTEVEVIRTIRMSWR